MQIVPAICSMGAGTQVTRWYPFKSYYYYSSATAKNIYGTYLFSSMGQIVAVKLSPYSIIYWLIWSHIRTLVAKKRQFSPNLPIVKSTVQLLPPTYQLSWRLPRANCSQEEPP